MTFRCTGGFAVATPDGTPHVIPGGALVQDDDPILKTHAVMFEPVETFTARRAAAVTSFSAVETATAEPGELRTVSKSPAAGKGRTQAKEE